MKNLKEIAELILLQVDHNREAGKDDKFTIDEIGDIIRRRIDIEEIAEYRLLEEYIEWFKEKFECDPYEKHHIFGITRLETLLALREDLQFKDNVEFQDKAAVVTFEEYCELK